MFYSYVEARSKMTIILIMKMVHEYRRGMCSEWEGDERGLGSEQV
jgi:hypothetical protein